MNTIISQVDGFNIGNKVSYPWASDELYLKYPERNPDVRESEIDYFVPATDRWGSPIDGYEAVLHDKTCILTKYLRNKRVTWIKIGVAAIIRNVESL